MRRANDGPTGPDRRTRLTRAEALLKTGALQGAIFNSANFSSIATHAGGVIQLFTSVPSRCSATGWRM